jgi:hypothetical protein
LLSLKDAWPWLTLAGLGIFHGINPAMGWLFAVALGMHRRSERLMLLALLPIALGHALAIGAAVALAILLDHFIELSLLSIGAGAILMIWAIWLLAYGHRHPVRVGMTTGMIGLGVWSFVMALAHGAGLMILPALLPLQASHAHMHGTAQASLGLATAAVAMHTAAMLAATAVMAVIVYRWIGLAILKRAWINFDYLWAGVLALGGTWLIWTGAWPSP